jgi:hypothetical protein
MAENITNIVRVNPQTFEAQTYSTTDEAIISNQVIVGQFGLSDDYVEYFVYSYDLTQLFPVDVPAVSYRNYTVTNDPYLQNEGFYSTINIDPLQDAANLGYDIGQFYTVYNFLRTKLSSSIDSRFFISEISPDRTEIRLDTTTIPDAVFGPLTQEFQAEISSSFPYYTDFYLNFGNNDLIIANNILLDNSNLNNFTVLVKLYEPLPQSYTLKNECWVVTQAAESIAYQIEITPFFDIPDDTLQLRGPNINLNLKDEINNSTDYQTFNSLTTTVVTGSFNQLDSLLEEKGIEINVDYSLYNNFVNLSSAYQRLDNFKYKLGLLQELQTSASLLSDITGSVTGSGAFSSSLAIVDFQINDIIRNFDGYEYYLYYESSSTTWPKQNASAPYILYPTGSATAITWFNSQSLVALDYDNNNPNNLYFSIPEYIREDSLNTPYILFTNMVGQSFDNSWLYIQDLSNRYDADNRINFGISKDLVADAIRSFGVKLYQNNFSSDDLYIAFLGYNPETGGFLPPTGSELITTYVTASAGNIPLDDVNKRIYKRIYHNLPYLLKKKGTPDALKALITIYGIPDTILRVSEFGGKDKINENDWDLWQDKFNYAYNFIADSDFIRSEFELNTSWNTPNTNKRPETVLFRFKTPNVQSAQTSRSQSLFVTDQGVLLSLEYSGSVNASGSYSGSLINPYNEYAFLTFYPDYNNSPGTSASVYLPFFDGGWWTTAITVDDSSNFTLYAANNIYNGDDGSQIGFIASQSVSSPLNIWDTSISSSFGNNQGSAFGNYGIFSGSLQEIKYYTKALPVSSFENITMNPDSIEAITFNGAPLELAFRATLGGELYTGSVSVHPEVTGSWVTTSSFANDSNFYIGNPSNFVPNKETIYFDQPVAGIRNIITNKVKPIVQILPEGDTLSRYIQIQQNSVEEDLYTNNISYVEVAFSPQNEINEDIMDQLGFFNLSEYIGDPRQRFSRSTSYPDLDRLRNEFFEKYFSNYDFTDYIRLIKYFDNSLFKMIKEFVPARTSLASGVVIKQNLLERQKYPQPLVTSSLLDYSGSIEMAFITGSAGGSVNQFNGLTNAWGVTQSWSESILTPYGVENVIHSSQDEFYNGEYSGSLINTDNGGELNLANPVKQVETTPLSYYSTGSNTATNPSPGQFFWKAEQYPVGGILAPDGPAGLKYMYINETDADGVNILQALQNLNPGDSITFTIVYDQTVS